MNMSIKACAPHHASSQKHLPSLRPGPAASTRPCPGHGYQPCGGLLEPGQPGTRSPGPCWLWQPPARFSLSTLPRCPGFGQTRGWGAPRAWGGLGRAAGGSGAALPLPPAQGEQELGQEGPSLSYTLELSYCYWKDPQVTITKVLKQSPE